MPVRRPARGELPGGTGVSPVRTGETPVPPGMFEPAARLNEVIDRCLAEEAMAWGELWQIAEESALLPIRQLLRRHRLDLTLAEDVMQMLYLYLRDEDCLLLRNFAGTTEAEFRGYLAGIALWFTQNLVGVWQSARKREERALRDAPLPVRDGPTEEDLNNVLAEVESLMSAPDFAKWQELQAADWPALDSGEEAETTVQPVPDRTRRWRLRTLCDRYRLRLIERIDL